MNTRTATRALCWTRTLLGAGVLAWSPLMAQNPVAPPAPPTLTARDIIEQLAPGTPTTAPTPAAPAPSPAGATQAPVTAPTATAADTGASPEPAASSSGPPPAAAERLRRNLRPVVRRIDLQIAFDFNAWALTPQGEEPLQQLAQAMLSERLLQTRFLIEGHTDAKGSAAYNERLSAQRARAVADYLVRQGVDASRLQAVGKGLSEPLPGVDPLSPANRRVRIVALD